MFGWFFQHKYSAAILQLCMQLLIGILKFGKQPEMTHSFTEVEKVCYLAASMLSVDVSWHGEAVLQDLLTIINWCLQQVAEVHMLRGILETLLPPSMNSLQRKTATMINMIIFYCSV